MIRLRLAVFSIFFLVCLTGTVSSLSADGEPKKLLVFHSLTCHRCVKAKQEVLPKIEKEYGNRITVQYFDLADIDNYKLLLGLRDKYSPKLELIPPVFFMEGRFVNGKADLQRGIEGLINASVPAGNSALTPDRIDLLSYFKSLKPLVILGAGLVDGVNPCAFTVIVFFISYLALQGYKRRELVAIGFSFIFSVFLTYLLLGLGIFNFLYSIRSFWAIAKIFNIAVGVFSVILGLLALYDLAKFVMTKETDGLMLQLPKSIKARIHAVIGAEYRRERSGSGGDRMQKRLFGLILGAFSTGFLVSLLEAVCTGQLYLPTIAFVLKASDFKLKALLYLLMYNIMFIIPLVLIFLLALLGVTSGQFGRFLKDNLVKVKALMAAVFLGLGSFLIWKG
jgi:cytochrome c biogenesis protein CcdA